MQCVATISKHAVASRFRRECFPKKKSFAENAMCANDRHASVYVFYTVAKTVAVPAQKWEKVSTANDTQTGYT
jgi:hypothetical protein